MQFARRYDDDDDDDFVVSPAKFWAFDCDAAPSRNSSVLGLKRSWPNVWTEDGGCPPSHLQRISLLIVRRSPSLGGHNFIETFIFSEAFAITLRGQAGLLLSGEFWFYERRVF